MDQNRKKGFVVLYLIIVVMVLIANVINSFVLDVVFKPLIVISLFVYLVSQKGHQIKAATFAMAGLLFSLVGDVLLIFQSEQPLFFMGGLISFLLAHVSYIVYYQKSTDTLLKKALPNKKLFFALMLVYGLVFYSFLYGSLGALKVPVFVYTAALVSMNVFALNRFGRVNDNSFKLILIGAMCFTLSDSLLAVNKFMMPLPLAGVWIIASYAAAQYFITMGFLSRDSAK